MGVRASPLSVSGQLSTEIPPLNDVLEMAQLSSVVYAFRGLEACPNVTNSSLSRRSKSSSSSSLLPSHITCHWYHHNHEYGTQVLIVSSQLLNYVAVVFAGTDDLRTALTDGDILMTSFGLIRNDTTTQLLLPPDVRIHAGFAHGLFEDELMPQIKDKVEQAMIQLHDSQQEEEEEESTSFLRWRRRKRKEKKAVRLFTTGHSLGAADSILTAVALTLLWNSTTSTKVSTTNTPSITTLPFQVNITSINFGCPQTGNYAWRQAVHEQLPIPNNIVQQLGIWRLVLGWDLVPRLPTSARPIVLWQHVGHTIQLRRQANRTECYYLHYGNSSDSSETNTTTTNDTFSYAGVPMGWSTTPFVILPSALYSHSIVRYLGFLQNKSTNALDDTTDYEYYCHDFVKHRKYNDSDHHHIAPDDDFWIQPPKASPPSNVQPVSSPPQQKATVELAVS